MLWGDNEKAKDLCQTFYPFMPSSSSSYQILDIFALTHIYCLPFILITQLPHKWILCEHILYVIMARQSWMKVALLFLGIIVHFWWWCLKLLLVLTSLKYIIKEFHLQTQQNKFHIYPPTLNNWQITLDKHEWQQSDTYSGQWRTVIRGSRKTRWAL